MTQMNRPNLPGLEQSPNGADARLVELANLFAAVRPAAEAKPAETVATPAAAQAAAQAPEPEVPAAESQTADAQALEWPSAPDFDHARWRGELEEALRLANPERHVLEIAPRRTPRESHSTRHMIVLGALVGVSLFGAGAALAMRGADKPGRVSGTLAMIPIQQPFEAARRADPDALPAPQQAAATPMTPAPDTPKVAAADPAMPFETHKVKTITVPVDPAPASLMAAAPAPAALAPSSPAPVADKPTADRAPARPAPVKAEARPVKPPVTLASATPVAPKPKPKPHPAPKAPMPEAPSVQGLY
jgi:hypothetical protein